MRFLAKNRKTYGVPPVPSTSPLGANRQSLPLGSPPAVGVDTSTNSPQEDITFGAMPGNMVYMRTLSDSTIATVQLPSAKMISVVVTKTDGIIEFYLDGSLLENDSLILPRLTCIGGFGLGDWTADVSDARTVPF